MPEPLAPFVSDADFALYVGDALEVLRGLPAESVHCIVTSPPYWGLRDYGTGAWDGGDPDCDHLKPPNAKDQTSTLGTPGHMPGANTHQNHAREPWPAGACGKCGARRVDQQLGLEATPDAYVANVVEVFRGVRRVLRRDGTCWLNLGDSYAAGGNGARDAERWPKQSRNAHGFRSKHAKKGHDVKPKDLVGIPWRVAFALQQPYYTGRIALERDRVWLAAMVDAEGCIHIHRRKAGTDSGAKFTKKDGTTVSYARTQDTYGVMVSVDNTSEAVIRRCEEIVGQGSFYAHEAGAGKSNRKQTLYRWTVTGQQSRELLRELYPYLTAKQHEARIAIGSESSGEQAARAHHAIKALHNGQSTDIDYPPPEGMWERGWFLRSEIIWAKCMPNPMPESVTDRPTKAHEQVFLLTKEPRYFYDADAIREQALDRPLSSLSERSAVEPSRRGDPGLSGHVTRTATLASVPGRNRRSVWEIATQPYPEAHFATFPEALVEPCILAGCPEWVCGTCGKPRERIVAREQPPEPEHRQPVKRLEPGQAGNVGAGGIGFRASRLSGQEMNRWRAENPGTESWSDCGHNNYQPGVVLDPFLGSGTTAKVARRHGRRSIGIELSPEYARLAAKRLSQLSLLADAASSVAE